MKPGVYVHIPFCEQRCYYCAFTVAVSPEETYEPYVRRLIREIELSAFKEPPETIFFGGGTPSIIDAALIEGILRALPPCTGEITIETNPGTLSDSKLDRYRDSGVNRISLGVQSFHDEDLRNAGRLHNAEDVFRDIQSLRNHSFENINVDLIAGLPNRGFGVSAHSFSGLRRFWNVTSMKEYAEMLDSGKLPISGEEMLTRDMRLEEAFLLGLRRTCGFDVWSVARDLDVRYPPEWFDRICELEDAGWIRFDGKVLELTPAGWLLANGVTEELLWPTLLSTSEATP